MVLTKINKLELRSKPHACKLTLDSGFWCRSQVNSSCLILRTSSPRQFLWHHAFSENRYKNYLQIEKFALDSWFCLRSHEKFASDSGYCCIVIFFVVSWFFRYEDNFSWDLKKNSWDITQNPNLKRIFRSEANLYCDMK